MQPKLKIERNLFDWILKFIEAIFIVLLFAFPAYYFGSLPEIIPSHFNAAGEVDDYANKSVIWILPSLAISIFV